VTEEEEEGEEKNGEKESTMNLIFRAGYMNEREKEMNFVIIAIYFDNYQQN
jgi:hypothetical protein